VSVCAAACWNWSARIAEVTFQLSPRGRELEIALLVGVPNPFGLDRPGLAKESAATHPESKELACLRVPVDTVNVADCGTIQCNCLGLAGYIVLRGPQPLVWARRQRRGSVQ